jgi:hypothetical protein
MLRSLDRSLFVQAEGGKSAPTTFRGFSSVFEIFGEAAMLDNRWRVYSSVPPIYTGLQSVLQKRYMYSISGKVTSKSISSPKGES